MSKLTWTVELSVDECWVADGFELTQERAEAMLRNDLQFATGYEVAAKIIKAPSQSKIRKLQGYIS